MLPALRRTLLVLIGVGFLDEYSTGLPVVAAWDVRLELTGDHAGYMLAVFVAPLLLSAFVEAPILLAADRWPRSRAIAVALAAMALAMLGCALSPAAWVFAASFAVYCTASGIACGLSQAALVESDPSGERAMARWTLAGELGDLGAPVAIWLTSGWLGWRWALVTATALLALWALLVSRLDLPRSVLDGEEEAEAGGLLATFKNGLTNRRLLAWSFACALCSLMDETLAAFGAQLVHTRVTSDPSTAITWTMAALSIGAATGLYCVERYVERIDPVRLLVACSCGCVVAYAGWLLTTSLLAAIVFLFLVGMFVAPLYPVTKAQAYRAAPGRGALVGAIDHLFVPIDFAAPLVLGLIADHWGLVAALSALLVQPLGVLSVSLWSRRGKPDEDLNA